MDTVHADLPPSGDSPVLEDLSPQQSVDPAVDTHLPTVLPPCTKCHLQEWKQAQGLRRQAEG